MTNSDFHYPEPTNQNQILRWAIKSPLSIDPVFIKIFKTI